MAIEGTDKSNHVFRRLDPILVQPISVKLFVPSFSGKWFTLYVCSCNGFIDYTVKSRGFEIIRHEVSFRIISCLNYR